MKKSVWAGARLRELREAAKMSRQELADAADVSIRSLEKWEQSVSEPTWTHLVDLCKALGVDCTAFTQPPAEQPEPKVGRPPKKKSDDAD